MGVHTARDNLQAIIRQARERHPELRIILAGMLAPPNMGQAYQKAFARIYPGLAKAEKVDLIPFLLKGVAGEPSLNLGDGIHPNPEGHRRIARLVLDVLDP